MPKKLTADSKVESLTIDDLPSHNHGRAPTKLTVLGHDDTWEETFTEIANRFARESRVKERRNRIYNYYGTEISDGFPGLDPKNEEDPEPPDPKFPNIADRIIMPQ